MLRCQPHTLRQLKQLKIIVLFADKNKHALFRYGERILLSGEVRRCRTHDEGNIKKLHKIHKQDLRNN